MTALGCLQAQVKRPAGSLPSLAVDGSTIGVVAPYGGKEVGRPAGKGLTETGRPERAEKRTFRSRSVGAAHLPFSLYCLPSLASCLASLLVC